MDAAIEGKGINVRKQRIQEIISYAGVLLLVKAPAIGEVI